MRLQTTLQDTTEVEDTEGTSSWRQVTCLGRALTHVPPFRAHRFWRTADLQTVRHFVTQPYYDLTPWPADSLWLPVSGGDRLAATLHTNAGGTVRPLVVLIHGLTGCADSHYVRASARAFLEVGYPVCRLNLRGSPPSRPGCRGHYHAGRSEDIRNALLALDTARPDVTAGGIVPVGFSLGGNMLLKFLAETEEQSPRIPAAGIVSAPIDLAATSRQFSRPRNWLYHRWLLRRLAAESTAPPAAISKQEQAAIESARSVYEFDDGFVAPHHGFAGADDYYARCSGLNFVDRIPTRTLLIHANDDPWIPSTAYRYHTWATNDRLSVLLTDQGGHLGFHARNSRVSWYNCVLIRFVEDVLKDRRDV